MMLLSKLRGGRAAVVILAALGALTAVAFQNCASKFTSASFVTAGSSFCSTQPDAPVCVAGHVATCSFGGAAVTEGDSVTAYLASNGTCVAQTRTCSHGVLSGSYAYARCDAGAAASCLFNGQTVASGASVQAFASANGATCTAETRVCQNGQLSGSFAFATCVAGATSAAPCLFNGQTIATGASVTAYAQSSVPSGAACVPQIRTCFNGSLSGAGDFAACQPAAPRSCLFNGQTVASGQSVTGFAQLNVPAGGTCAGTTRLCTDGTLSGAGDAATCTVAPPAAASCSVNGQTVPNGGTLQFYQSAVAPPGVACAVEQRTCANGTLSGSATATGCVSSVTAEVPVQTLGPSQVANFGALGLAFQGDGNLVLYRGGQALWNSGTGGRGCGAGCSAGLQGDGNIVLYQNGQAYWQSGTGGRSDAHFIVSMKPPYLSVRAGDGRTLWGGGANLSWFTALPRQRGFPGVNDYQNLFATPAAWARAAGHVNVFKVYYWQIVAMNDQDLRQMIEFLAARNIALAIEAGVMSEGAGCGQNVEGYVGLYPESTPEAIGERMQALGGQIDYLDMDEPISFGHYGGCRFSTGDLAANVSAVVARYRVYFPAMSTGLVDSYFQNPDDFATTYAQFADQFAAANGAPLAFFHDDFVLTFGAWSARVGPMHALLAKRNIPYGPIINGTLVNNVPTDSSAHWTAASRARAQTITAMGVNPEQVVFQSWDQNFPDHALPDSDDSAETSVINFWFEDPARGAGGPASLYAFTSGNGSLLTTSASESALVQSQGYATAGIAAFVYPTPAGAGGLVAMTRLVNGANDHYYTCSPDEVAIVQSAGYRVEGTAGYAYPAGDPRGLPFYSAFTAAGTHVFGTDPNALQARGRLETVHCSTPVL